MISIKGLYKKYTTPVIHDLSLSVEPNTFLHIQGKNGAGKTTLLKIIAGIESKDQGIILIDQYNQDTQLYQYISRVGYLSDSPFLYPYLTGDEHLKMDLNIRKYHDEKTPYHLAEKLELTQEQLAQPTKTYSKGMKQKLAFILGIYHHPTVLLMDEPFTGMDQKSLETAIHISHEMMKGKIILFSSHQEMLSTKLSTKSIDLTEIQSSHDKVREE
ncbi:ATP-binding cassette domain-containing protein [Rossellomorea vietnamensis]|uniref:ATP-binding cassette domain-containing protein n=1 Tax=Rossellomorea vietnamensis TaxID=218284 RepID=A0A6I6UWF5_9BACI|nr:ABC transporter ATP-binding protein [Rossellomorea vietnamensis]QHE63306.1 ATP-binding cassette domain-containing protein [Rossellomorea vietnamensis]